MCFIPNPEKTIGYHERDLVTAIRTLQKNLPRTMVNLVTPPSEYEMKHSLRLFITHRCFLPIGMKVIAEFRGKPDECEATHRVECPCTFGLANRNKRQRYFEIMERWKDVVEKVAKMEEFNTEVLYLYITHVEVNKIDFFCIYLSRISL